MSKRRTLTVTKPRVKNAYELLEKVCEVIKEEPRRYDQTTWGISGKQETKRHYENTAPACGTVACRAGWIVFLHDGPQVFRRATDIESRAKEIIGLSLPTGHLFSEGACVTERRVGYEDLYEDSTVKKHAEEGVKGLQRYMKKYSAKLKARKLSDVPKVKGSW